MSTPYEGFRKRKAQAFRAKKPKRSDNKLAELELVEAELKGRLILARTGNIDSDSGKEINRLATKARRLRRKLGLPLPNEDVQENEGAQYIPS